MNRPEQPELPTPLRRFKPYPAYKDSGVEWLGKIPSHWSVARVSDLTSVRNGYPFDAAYFVREGGIPLVRIRDLNGADTEVNYIGPVVEGAWINPGDVLVGMDGDFNVARWNGRRALLNQRLCCLTPRSKTEIGFIAHSLPTPLRFINDLTYSTTVKHLSSGDIRKVRLGTPPVLEQRAIAEFLDRETARIDGLVAMKQRLIELLQEERAALIARAVTKGLDPNVRMKNSGGWLGDVPAHWEVKRIKWAARMVSGHTPDKKVESYWQGGDIPWVSLADTQRIREADYISNTAVKTTADGIANSSAHVLPENTVVFSRDATIGLCAITKTGMAVSQHFIGWVCGSELQPEYLLHALRSMTQELERMTMGATVRTIGMPDVKSLTTPVPPIDEQENIVRYILEQRSRIDSLISKVQAAIDRLGELRSTLISAVVTGKIDVREQA